MNVFRFPNRFAIPVTLICLLIGWSAVICWGQDQQKNLEQLPNLTFRKDAQSGAKYRKNLRDFFLKQIKLYEQHTKDPLRLRQKAKQYLRSSISSYTRQLSREDDAWQPKSELFFLGKKLIDDGCQDPLVWMYHAQVVTHIKYDWGRGVGLTEENRPISFVRSDHPLTVANRAMTGYKNSTYPSGLNLLFLGAVNNANDRSYLRRKQQQLVHDDLLVYNSIAAWIDFVRESSDWERIAYSVIKRIPIKNSPFTSDVFRSGAIKLKGGASLLAKIQKLNDDDQLTPWLYQMMLADHHNCVPSSQRTASAPIGAAYRKKIIAEIPEEAKQARRLAAENYRAAHLIASARPEAAARLILSAYEKYDADDRLMWFQKAIDAEIDNRDAYDFLLLTSDLMTPEALSDIAYQFFHSERFDTDIPRQFLYFTRKMRGYAHRLSSSEKLFNTTQQIFDKYAEEDGVEIEDAMLNQRQAKFLRGFVYTAARARRFDVAVKYAQLLDRLSPHWFARTKDRVFLNSMIHAWHNYEDELRDIRIGFDYNANLPNVDLEELYTRYDALAEESEPVSEPYLRMCAILAKEHWEYEQGKWVTTTNEFPADHLWGILGNFLCKGGGVFDVSNAPKMAGGTLNQDFTLEHCSGFALPREMHCDIILLNFKGDVEFGIQSYRSINNFLLIPQKGLAKVEGKNHRGVSVPIPGLEPQKPIHIVLRIWDAENYQFFVNGIFVDVGDLPLEKAQDVLAFGGTSIIPRKSRKKNATGYESPEIAIQISNIRIRKMDFAPPPPQDQHAKGLAYFTDAINREPEVAYNYLRRGKCNHELGKIEEAIADFRNGLQRDPRVGRATIHFIQLCLATDRSAEAQQQLLEALKQFRAADKVISGAASTLKSLGKNKKQYAERFRAKQLQRSTLAGLKMESREQLLESISNCEDQSLLLYVTSPDDAVRTTKKGAELLEAMDFESESTSGLRWLTKAYAHHALNQYDQAIDALEKAKTKTKMESADFLTRFQFASEAISKREPIHLTGDQVTVIK